MNETNIHLQASLLMYDIPDNSNIPNPSNRLQEYAVRINLSVWVVPNDSIPYTLLNELSEAGAVWEVIKFDASEGPRLVEKAIKAIRRDVNEYVTRARQSMSEAAHALANGQEPPEVMHKRYKRQSSAICRRVNQVLKAMDKVSKRFGISAGQLDLQSAHLAVRGIKEGMNQRARLYAEAIEEIKKLTRNRSDAMARSMERDAVPAMIAADYIDDHGGDASALRAAFEGE